MSTDSLIINEGVPVPPQPPPPPPPPTIPVKFVINVQQLKINTKKAWLDSCFMIFKIIKQSYYLNHPLDLFL